MMPMTNSFGWVDVDPEKSYMDAAKVRFLMIFWKTWWKTNSDVIFKIIDAETSLPAKIQLENFGELLVGQSILLTGKKVYKNS